ncbi:uncharacterized protein LOC124136054 [Haliotis rufescens]|uniref:uncharacterized protein LOC124136054 n=1 Tax=Haliotis rufescens TaxID=6454 RepID=UPI00201FA77A|nr:uncharacterized protein LOC124136054 [Haliotis rufescens]
MNLIEISGILLWICVRYTLGNDGCKLDAFQRCFQSQLMDMSGPDSARSMCVRQRLSKSLQCMEKIKSECETELRRTIDTAAWKEAVALYCDNTDLFADNVNCTQRVRPFMRTCSTSRMIHFAQRIARRNITMTDPKTGMQLTCEHIEDTLECVDSKLTRKCPDNARNVLMKVIRLFSQPTCMFGPYVDTTVPPTLSTPSQQETITNTSSRMTAAYIIVLALGLVHLLW